MKTFRVPSHPQDLLNASDDTYLAVQTNTAVASLDAESIQSLADGVVYDLINNTALCIRQQQQFDNVYCLIRDFCSLPALAQTHLVDSLCTSLSILTASASALLASRDDTADKDAVAEQHYSALKAYTFFLHWIIGQAEQQAKEAAKSAPATAPAAKGRSKAKKATQLDSQWDWDANKDKIAKTLAKLSEVDFWQLCHANNPEEAFLVRWTQAAILLMSSASGAKATATKEGAFRILSCCALRYKQLDQLLAVLTDMLNKDEHMSVMCAELAEFAAQQFGDNQLAVEMLREVSSVEPSMYEQQQQADAAGVRSVAGFIAELSDRLPLVVASNISLLAPHLGGKAYPIRSAIVTAIGHLIHRAVAPSASGADAQGTAARLRSKQQLLQTLVDRVRDQNAYTRARVLQTWAHLAEKKAVPLGHWVCVTEIAVGRLEDKAAIVRKCTLQLLSKLLCFNPFNQFLPEEGVVAALEQQKKELQEMQPSQTDADPAEWAEGQLQPDLQPPPTEGRTGAAAVNSTEPGLSADSDQEISANRNSRPEANGPASGEDMQVDSALAEGQDQEAPAEGPPRLSSFGRTLEETRAIVASLQTGVQFIRVLSQSLSVVTQLLASSTMTDVQEAITLLIYCHKFQIRGSQAAIRKMLPLMFSQEQGVKDAVVNAVEELYLKDTTGSFMDPRKAAENLVALAQGSSLGELGALEEVVGQLMTRGLLKPMTLKALWFLCSNAHEQLVANEVRSSLAVISMAAMKQPHLVAERLDLLLKVGFSNIGDALVTRQACIALTQLSRLPERLPHSSMQAAYKALAHTLLSDSLPSSTWYTAAEAAVTAVYALHPAPQELAQAVVSQLGKAALQGAQGSVAATDEDMEADDSMSQAGSSSINSAVSANRLSRLLFALGQVAIQHLLHVERLAKEVRRKRADAEKASAEAQHTADATPGPAKGHDSEDEDIAAQLGVGSLTADVELDALKDAAEGEILAMHNLVGRYAPLLVSLCHNRALLGAHAHLRSSALLALTKLMAIDSAFCESNLALVFTLLEKRLVEPKVRSNLVIALGDLAFRFPNLLEPWTERIYGPLSDPDTGVRKNSLMVLTHLIMNDMMKVKGHIARMALCLQDPDPGIKDLAHLFFHELAQKNYKGTSPIYNLLPDMLSNLSSEAGLPQEQFQAIMRHLLSFIAKEKQVDCLMEKLCLRFQATQERKQWRNIGFCLGQLSIGEKGFRKMADMFRCYKDCLADPPVLTFFQGCIAKAKKLPKLSAESKADIEAFEDKLTAAAAEQQEAKEGAANGEQQEATEEDAVSEMQQEKAQGDAADGPTEQSDNASSSSAMPGSDTAAAADKAELDSATLEDQQGLQPGVTAVEHQLQQMELQDAHSTEQQGESSADAQSKENRQQNSNQNAESAKQAVGRTSLDASQAAVKGSNSSKAPSTKTRRSTRSSANSTSSAAQASAAQDSEPSLTADDDDGTQAQLAEVSSAALDSAPQSSAALHSSTAESAALETAAQAAAPGVSSASAQQLSPQRAVTTQQGIAHGPENQEEELNSTGAAETEAVVTPVKAQQTRPANDLDRLLGSRLKAVRPQEGIPRQPQHEAPSPVAALRGQLRRVRLESGPEAASPVKQSLGNKENDGGQAAPIVQLRKIKQEPLEDQSSNHSTVEAQIPTSKTGVSALKGFWETHGAAKTRNR